MNYHNGNDFVIESLYIDEEIIQKVIDTPVEDDQDTNDNCVLPNISLKSNF